MRKLLCFFLALISTSCATENKKPIGAVAELLAVDRAFATRAREVGPHAAFIEFASDDVRVFPEGQHVLRGKSALAQWVKTWPDSFEILWDPQEAYTDEGGKFGYTWGYAEFRISSDPDAPQISYGKYITVWRKDLSGEWRWIADIGNSAPPPNE